METPPPLPRAYDPIVENLRQLALFFRIAAALLGLMSFCFLPHALIGLSVLINAGSFFGTSSSSTSSLPPAWAGLMFLLLGGGALLVHFGTGLALWRGAGWIERRERYVLLQVASGICLIFMPIGTALGIYALVTLTRPDIRAQFLTPDGQYR